MNSLTALSALVLVLVGTEGFSYGRYDGSNNGEPLLIAPAPQGFNNFDPFNIQQRPEDAALMSEEVLRPFSYPRYPQYQANQAQIFSYPNKNRFGMNQPQYEGYDEMYNPFHSHGNHVNRIIIRPGGHHGYNPYGRRDYYGGSTFRSDSGVSTE